MWIDTHAHLDFWQAPQAAALAHAAALAQVNHCVIPAVAPQHFHRVREMAHDLGYSYALGIHPCHLPAQLGSTAGLDLLARALQTWGNDPRLVAVGEIGLDFFLPERNTPALRQLQIDYFKAQLQLARSHQLPALLHTRKSVDTTLKYLRQIPVCGGIAHAFNGSMQQATVLLQLGFKLGFGGAVTYPRAHGLQTLLRELPATAIVMETDAPDMPPAWIYTTAAQRAGGTIQTPNTPEQLARIAQNAAQMRQTPPEQWQQQTYENTLDALPKLRNILNNTPKK